MVLGFHAYPNPFSSTLNILIDNPDQLLLEIELLNLLGQKLYGRSVRQDFSDQLDVSHLPAGIYMVQMRTAEGQVISKKMVKN